MTEIKEKKSSLWDLQDAVLRAEDEINSTENITELIGNVADKIDNIKMVIDILEADALRWSDYAKEMSTKKKSAEAAVERLKEYVTTCVLAHGTKIELGKMWKCLITEHERVVLTKEATIDDVLEYGSLGIVRTKYDWEKKDIKSLLESGNEDVKKIAKIEKTNSIKFTPNTRNKSK